jgi:hypothetical protein
MKLRPTQIVGLCAIVVFGGILVFTLTKPKRDPYAVPGAMVMHDAPAPVTLDIPTIAPVPLPAPLTPMDGPAPAPPSTPEPAVMPADPFAVGSQDAKDDLYCAGVMTAANKAETSKPGVKDKQIYLSEAIGLDSAGGVLLIKENNISFEVGQIIAKAWSDKAQADYAAGAPRLSKESCMARLKVIEATPVR